MSIWVNSLPAGWQEARLKTRLERNDGGAWGDDPEGEGDTMVLRSTEQAVDGSWKIADPAFRKLTPAERDGTMLHEGDLVVTKSSGSELHIGKTSLVTSEVAELRAGYSNFMQRLRVDGRTEPRFVHYWMNNSLCREQFAYLSNSTSGLANLNAGLIGAAVLSFPPKEEQERIASFLDVQTARIDSLIAAKEELASSLKDSEEVTGFDLVTGGLFAGARRVSYSESWLAEMPAHWQLSKLRHVASIGNGSTPKRDKDEYWVGGLIPWLNSGAVNAPRIQEASDYVTEAARKECHLPMVRRGSTVVALTGQGKTRGTAAITEIETTINQHLAYVSPFDTRLTDEFLWVALKGFYSVLRYLSEGEGSTKGALTCEQLNHFRIPLPPLEEQALIVRAYRERTQAIEELLAHAREHIECLREYRSSLISAAVTGQLPVHAELKEAA